MPPNPYQSTGKKRMVKRRISVDIATIIGLWPFERECPQPLTIRLCGRLKNSRIHRLRHTRQQVVDYFRKTKPQLLEKAALDLAHLLHPFLKPKERMSILIKKPQAIKNADWAGVQIDIEA